MNVAQRLEARQSQWLELERLCDELERKRWSRIGAASLSRFASLYRGACADLALADAYHLPPATVRYLHRLVGRAHNRLYRSRRFDVSGWAEELFVHVPRRLFQDGALRISFVTFWGFFLASVYLASDASMYRDFARQIAGEDALTQVEQMYENPIGSSGSASGMEPAMSGFYLFNNTRIGLYCFAAGLLLGIGGLFTLVFNAIMLGTIFGHMTTVPQSENFYHFVTAHGPFELTAVVVSAAAGMRLGFALVDTGGLTRSDAVRRAARQATPTMGAAMALFFMAAMIEGFLSPSRAPYEIKAAVAVLSTLLLMFYFVILGLPRETMVQSAATSVAAPNHATR